MKRIGRIIIPILVLSMLLVGCGKKEDKSVDYAASESSTDSGSYDMVTEDATAIATDMETDVSDTNSTADATMTKSSEEDAIGSSSSVEANRKIIRNVSMSLETQEFDKVTEAIQKKITDLGGYAESVDMSDLLNSTNRYCSITARIPASKLDQFVNVVSKEGNVVSKNISAQDITVNYVDMESHVKVLKIEQERLIALIEKAVDLDSIILLENRLTEIRYDLENYQSQLRMYDNQVEYSTVTITVDEVIRYSTVVDKKSILDQMKSGLSDTMYSIKMDIEDFAIFVVVNIPYIIFWGVVVGGIIIVIRRKTKKNKRLQANNMVQNKDESQPTSNDNENNNYVNKN